jgi:hypothetical protein
MLRLLAQHDLRAALSKRVARRVVQFLAFCGVLLSVSSAWAAAPMCDAQGQTIAAPPELAPSEGGEIRAVATCNPLDQITPGVAHRDSSSANADAPPRALPFVWMLPVLPVSTRQRFDGSLVGGARPGHAPGVFHPPCGR